MARSAPVAQGIEQLPSKQWAACSNHAGGALPAMLHYPKMPGPTGTPSGRCVAFEKYDGTNLHWEWDRDFGWHSFGPRRGEFNLDESGVAAFCAQHEQLSECAPLFHDALAAPLDEALRSNESYQPYRAVKV